MEEETETIVNPPESHETPPVPPHTEHGQDELHQRVNTLSSKVDELAGMVESLTTQADTDSSPVRRPWTHWGSK